MADRVEYRPEPDAVLPIGGQSALSRPTVEIRTRDGRVLRSTPDGVPGDPMHPVSWDLLEAKFRDCISFSAKPLDTAAADRVLGLVHDLERLQDATEIVRHLA
jgi:hypothetical protein